MKCLICGSDTKPYSITGGLKCSNESIEFHFAAFEGELKFHNPYGSSRYLFYKGLGFCFEEKCVTVIQYPPNTISQNILVSIPRSNVPDEEIIELCDEVARSMVFI
jgi:hypothetical protein